jgi:5-methylthioadenosine/S-adenosylhomocysteine deaminase
LSLSSAVIIQGATVVTCDANDTVLVGDVAFESGRIVEVAEKAKPRSGARVIDGRGCIVMPGFVQVHVHLCQVLFRGQAEDRALLPWLKERIWPLEGAHSKDTLRASARLGLAELLRGGTTTALDMGTVRHTEAIFEAARDLGFRLISGKSIMDKPSPGAASSTLDEKTDAALRGSDDLAARWHGAENGRLGYAFAPRFILSCTDRALTESAALARKRGCMIHTHASENPGEIEAVLQVTGKRNVHALAERGLVGKDVLLAHCVHVDDSELKLLAETQTRVAHCPSTNLKLASGTAPIPDMQRRGIPVGLGADGAPCNNRLSAFSEMRLAALLQKPMHGAEAMPARSVVRLATIEGARALGLDREIGSIEAGKRADLIVIDGNAPHLRPRGDPFTTVVYAAEAQDVKHVFVDGRWLVRERDLVGQDDLSILDDADRALDEVMARAKIARAR